MPETKLTTLMTETAWGRIVESLDGTIPRLFSITDNPKDHDPAAALSWVWVEMDPEGSPRSDRC